MLENEETPAGTCSGVCGTCGGLERIRDRCHLDRSHQIANVLEFDGVLLEAERWTLIGA